MTCPGRFAESSARPLSRWLSLRKSRRQLRFGLRVPLRERADALLRGSGRSAPRLARQMVLFVDAHGKMKFFLRGILRGRHGNVVVAAGIAARIAHSALPDGSGFDNCFVGKRIIV